MDPIRARVFKDQENPDRLMPWQARIPGQITISFSSFTQALLYANHRIRWLRKDFQSYVAEHGEKMIS